MDEQVAPENGEMVLLLCVEGWESITWFLALTSSQLHKDFGDTNFLGVVVTKLCATSYKKIRKRSKIVQRLVTIAGTGINFLGETAAQYLHPSLQICTLSQALLWKSVDFEEWSDRKTLDQNFSDLALQFSDRSIEFLYSSVSSAI